MNIRKLHNKNNGTRCFILANGPSVASENLSLLNNEIVIGMNGSPLLESKFSFKTSYYVVTDERFFQDETKKSIAWGTTGLRVFRDNLKPFDNPKLSTNTAYIRSIGRDGFSLNLAKGFYFGCTTTMLALQLAFYIGSNEIFILGLDLTYQKGMERFYQESKPQEYDDFMGIQIKNIRDAFLTLKTHGVNLHQCSQHSNIRPYLPYIEFKSLF
jgi:hypothetical protein